MKLDQIMSLILALACDYFLRSNKSNIIQILNLILMMMIAFIITLGEIMQ